MNEDLKKAEIQLETDRLQLEREKFEFEKQKTGERNKNAKKSDSVSVSVIISAVAVSCSTFLPWVSTRASGFGTSFSASLNGLNFATGIVSLLCGLAAIALCVLKNKFRYIPFIISTLLCISAIAGFGNLSASGYGASLRGGFGLGTVVGVVSSVAGLIFCFVSTTSTDGSNALANFFVRNKKILLLIVATAVVLLVVERKGVDLHSTSFAVFLRVAAFLLAYFIFRNFGYKRIAKVYLVTSILLFTGQQAYKSFRLASYEGIVGNDKSPFIDKMMDSLSLTFSIFVWVYYISLVAAALTDLADKHPEKFKIPNFFKTPKIFHPGTIMSLYFMPLILCYVVLSLSRTYLSQADKLAFIEKNSFLAGTWYVPNSDTTDLIVVSISRPEELIQIANTDSVAYNLTYSIGRLKAENYVESGYSIQRASIDGKLKFPLKLSRSFTISSISKNELKVKLFVDNFDSVEFVGSSNRVAAERLLVAKQEATERKLQKLGRTLVFEEQFGPNPNQVATYILVFKGEDVEIRWIYAGNKPYIEYAKLVNGRIFYDGSFDYYVISENQLCVSNQESGENDCYPFIRSKSTHSVGELIN